MVDLALLGNDVGLNGWIRRRAAAVYARRVANIPSDVQSGFRRSLECDTQLHGNAEAFAVTMDQVSETYSHHGRHLIEVNFALGCCRIRWIAEILLPT